MAVQNMPAAEFEVTEELVRRLLADQHPDLVERPLSLVANGWDNVIYRLGDDLTVRLPRRQVGADLVANEHRWLPGLAARLPIAIAAPVRTGAPQHGYPWVWSICPWFDGDVAADSPLADPSLEANRLGAFVAALHAEDASQAPENPHRGQPLAELRTRIETNLGRLSDQPWSAAAWRLLDDLGDLDEWPLPGVLLHGDLHTANMIVRDGAIVAVLDFGDLTSGDPACDLAVAWMLFAEVDRDAFRAAAAASHPLDDATWQRGRLWALHFALLYLLHSADSERFARMGSTLVLVVLDE